MLDCKIRAVYCLFATLACCVLVRGSHAEERQFPYTGYVQVESAAVRSGPGSGFYTTDRFHWGTRVEVYRHHEDGWVAIRPPEGSFSWLRSEVLEPTGQAGLSRVIADDVRSAVGTRYGHRRDAQHVQLKVGEIVEVLGHRELSAQNGAEAGLWTKIAPPAGEFRWMRETHVSPDPPTQQEEASERRGGDGDAVEHSSDDLKVAPRFDTESTPLSPVALSPVALSPVALSPVAERKIVSVLDQLSDSITPSESEPQSTSDEVPNHDVRAARVDEQIAAWETLETGVSDRPEEEYAIAQPIETHVADQERASLASGFREVTPRGEGGIYLAERDAGLVAPPPPRRDAVSGRDLRNDIATRQFGIIIGIGQERLADELSRVDLALTQDIVKAPSEWELSSLRARAQAVIDTSDSAELRRRGHDLLATIAKFEDVQRRHTQLMAGDVPEITSASSLAGWGSSAVRGGAQPVLGQPAARPDYDGKGWLMPVVTRRAGTPHYALTDDSGNILQFVTPPPGMNLKKYERRRIAIYGQQGYLPQLNKPHLTAQRIISLDVLR